MSSAKFIIFSLAKRYLWRPVYRIFRPLVRKIDQYRITRVSVDDLISQQVSLFGDAGLNYVDAHRVVAELIGEHTESKGHRSQHYELFAALTQKSRPMRILEIGTSDASFTAFMASVCPNAIVETIDLPVPKTDIKFREKYLRSSPNITFREMNSLLLCHCVDPKYDLIWVDGDHTFPIVACDIANAVRLLKSDGVIMCDDIYLSHRVSGRGYEESLKVLTAFTEAKLITTHFVLKSIKKEKNFSRRQKHLAIVRLAS